MEDIEIITERNHRRVRERELGERWEVIVKQRKNRSNALKMAEAVCVVVACMAAGASAVFFGFGFPKSALVTCGVAAIFGFGAVAFYDP